MDVKRIILLATLGAFIAGCTNSAPAEKPPAGDPPPIVEGNPDRHKRSR